MKKSRSASFLAGVAIVSSATVLQIREHMRSPDVSAANARATMSSCGATRDGLVPAGCEPTPTRGERQMEHAPQPQQGARRQVWV
jgi:hypothetical protein